MVHSKAIDEGIRRPSFTTDLMRQDLPLSRCLQSASAGDKAEVQHGSNDAPLSLRPSPTNNLPYESRGSQEYQDSIKADGIVGVAESEMDIRD
jgi:hypothetical protein